MLQKWNKYPALLDTGYQISLTLRQVNALRRF
jgi:hypothetical protein